MAVTRQRELMKARQRKAKLARLRVKYLAARSQDEKAAILSQVSRIAVWIKPEEFVKGG